MTIKKDSEMLLKHFVFQNFGSEKVNAIFIYNGILLLFIFLVMDKAGLLPTEFTIAQETKIIKYIFIVEPIVSISCIT